MSFGKYTLRGQSGFINLSLLTSNNKYFSNSVTKPPSGEKPKTLNFRGRGSKMLIVELGVIPLPLDRGLSASSGFLILGFGDKSSKNGKFKNNSRRIRYSQFNVIFI